MQALQGSMAAMDEGSGTVPYSWWQAAGTIPDANIKEHVENPTTGQLYAGGTISDAWSIAVRTTKAVGINQYVLDCGSGRLVFGMTTALYNGFYISGWSAISLFTDALDAIYYLISDGTSVQAYRDNVAIGAPATSGVNIGGTVRWRSEYNNVALNKWLSGVPRGAIYNIAISPTQRAALYTSMSS